MDRIRKALDLARQERDRGFDAEPARPRGAEGRVAHSMTARPISIEYTHTRIFTPDQNTLEAHRVLSPAADATASAAFRMLRTQVIQRMDERGWRSIAVVSPGMNDGKTTTAINLAVNLANDRRHTALLVDCDLRRPGVAKSLGIEPELGMDDLLRGDAQIGDCLYHPDGYDRLVVLPARGPLENSSEALAGPRGREMVTDLRGRYPERIIVFDLPPVLATDDALSFLPLVECALVVVSERVTRRDDLLRCMELLKNTPVVGTVLNKAFGATAGYG